jgi:hypothetical protein
MSIFVQSPASTSAQVPHIGLAPHWLMHLGALGLFSVAVIDSSVIPLPIPGSTDLLLLWLVAHSGDPWLLAPCTIAGSLLGGYTTWHIGRRGEEALRRYVPAHLLGRIVGWIERHPILSIFVPLCFHRRYRSCHLRLRPVRWVSRAPVFLRSSEQHAACDIPL